MTPLHIPPLTLRDGGLRVRLWRTLSREEVGFGVYRHPDGLNGRDCGCITIDRVRCVISQNMIPCAYRLAPRLRPEVPGAPVCAAPIWTAQRCTPPTLSGGGGVVLHHEGTWSALAPPDAERPFNYTRNMRTVKELTGASSSSVVCFGFSASAVVSDIIPPEGCSVG